MTVKFDKEVKLGNGDSYTLGLFRRPDANTPETLYFLYSHDENNTNAEDGVAIVLTETQLHELIDNANALMQKVRTER